MAIGSRQAGHVPWLRWIFLAHSKQHTVCPLCPCTKVASAGAAMQATHSARGAGAGAGLSCAAADAAAGAACVVGAGPPPVPALALSLATSSAFLPAPVKPRSLHNFFRASTVNFS